MFSYNMIPTINITTRVTRNTNTVVYTKFKSGIIQTDLSDHFSYYICPQNNREYDWQTEWTFCL